MRKIFFDNNEYYHIYNRGVNKQNIFIDEKDFWKFFDNLRDFNNDSAYEERLNAIGLHAHSFDFKEPSALKVKVDYKALGSFLETQEKVVDVISYTINPNHPHLILKQLKNKGISNFMHKVGLSYTNYFNKNYGHSGHVFQGQFKAIHIDSEQYLLWLIGYVNGNIAIHGLDDAENYPWSSYGAIFKALGALKNKEPSALSNLSVLSGLEAVLPQFSSPEEFKKFVKQVIKESKENKAMKKYLLEDI